MDDNVAAAVIDDFQSWSGGFPPESEEQIFVCVETARPIDTDSEDVPALLRRWMNQEAASSDAGE